MKTLQKAGGFAALYMAAAYLIGIVIFLVVLDTLSITDPVQKVALNVEKVTIVFSTNLLMYVFFGVALIVLALALYRQLKGSSHPLMQIALAIGVVWAGSLIASGMVANAGLSVVVPLYAKDPAQAALTWQAIEVVADGLGNANGEILGGLFTLMISLGGLRTGGIPRGLNLLGLGVGALGIVTLVPVLTDLAGVFGLGQIVWFVGLGIVLLRNSSPQTAQ